MGSFANSAHLKHADAAAVARAIERYLANEGYRPTDQPPDDSEVYQPEAPRRAVHVAEAQDGWVSILDSDLMGLPELVAELSAEFDTYGVLFFVNDSDSWHYQLYQAGQQVDEFDSVEEVEREADEIAEGLMELLGGDAPPGSMQERVQEGMRQFQEQMEAQMPGEIRVLHEQLLAGQQVAPEAMSRYMQWTQAHAQRLLGDFGAMIAAAAEAADEEEVLDGEDLGLADYDETEPEMAEESEEEEAFSLEEDLDEDESVVFEEDDEFADDEVSLDTEAHVEALRPLLSVGVSEEDISEILERQEVFAEQTLADFLPAIGIPSYYAYLSYRYLEDATPEELSAQSIRFTRHLKFAAPLSS